MTINTKRRQTPRFARLVFLAFGGLIALTATSLLLLGYLASQIAAKEASAGDRRLFDNTLRSRFLLITRDQHTLARWDRTVANVVLTFDKIYVQEEMVDSLWHDFRHDRSWFIAADGKVLAEAWRNEVDFSGKTLPGGGHDVRLIAELAARRHTENRISIPGGYGQRKVATTQAGRPPQASPRSTGGPP
ncbi:MAG: CHASE4 domain-containing protein [Breoghania sp.]|nr:CHASE4 domain-containing protein [Breoghania sp.]